MLHVFISYSAQRRDLVKTLAEDIRALGHEVWFDQELVGGHVWWERILTEISNCDLLVFALAPEAMDSTPCRLEYSYAFSLGKTILPVLVAEGVSFDVLPAALSNVQYVDYRRADKQSAFALNKSFNSLPASKPLPDQLPSPPTLPVSFLGSLKEQIEASETLSFHEQTALVVKLKDRLRDHEQANEVRRLLARLRQRDDLFSKVAEEIDLVVGDVRHAAAPEDSKPVFVDTKRDVTATAPVSVQAKAPSRKQRYFVRTLIAAAVGFVASLGIALTMGGERYLGSAQLWEVDFWLIWPFVTVVLWMGFAMLARLRERLRFKH